MKALFLTRILFVVLFMLGGYALGGEQPMPFVLFGLLVGLVVVFFEIFTRKLSLKDISSALFGILLGLIMAKLTCMLLQMLFSFAPSTMRAINIFVTLTWVYFGLTLGLKGRGDFNIVIPYVKFKRQELREEEIVVDTSSIIDGRILDMVKTGFIEARFIVPRFVLNELHALADSTEHLKRQKGKRGIEILHALNKEQGIEVEISDQDFEDIKSVDEKIVKLGATLSAKVLTTDYNLNRVAQLQGVKVLNINDLSNALKPSFIAGERFNLKLIKEGKEHNQAVGYLEDGTMVVVENAKWLIGKTVEVEVTSILQSPSGRIVFTKLTG